MEQSGRASAEGLAVDVRDGASVRTIVRGDRATRASIDILVNTAGVAGTY
jgi:NADP-dependent 3-hydroxy acid dehydrogenase YdfG